MLAAPPAIAEPAQIRVCADPNNLPFSNEHGEGFENKLAELVARDLGEEVSDTWRMQRRGFIRNMLKAGLCDVVMGVPARNELVETTPPYHRSTYVFACRADRKLDLRSLKDPRLCELTVGVHLIGSDGFNTPPAHALARERIVGNVVGFTVYGDHRGPKPVSADRLGRAETEGGPDVITRPEEPRRRKRATRWRPHGS